VYLDLQEAVGLQVLLGPLDQEAIRDPMVIQVLKAWQEVQEILEVKDQQEVPV
jgi:hypothetical protein